MLPRAERLLVSYLFKVKRNRELSSHLPDDMSFQSEVVRC